MKLLQAKLSQYTAPQEAKAAGIYPYFRAISSEQDPEVIIDGKSVELSFKEFELLRMLLINQGIVLSRDKIMDQIWGFDYEGESRTVDMHIKTLRQKLGEGGAAIQTVRNVGYVIGR